MRATVQVRAGDHYRADCFSAGLRRHGYEVERTIRQHPDPGDLLVIWNRVPMFEPAARRYESAGGRVIVAENGYLNRTAEGAKTYAIALGHHLGAGRWFVGDEARFPIQDETWGPRGNHVLVLPQRGIGERGVAMPTDWPRRVRERLAGLTDRPLIMRPHPGTRKVPIEPDFARAFCVVTWASGAAIQAIKRGIPSYHAFPDWIGNAASSLLAENIEAPYTPDRDALWRRVSWAQWTIDEIASGQAFDLLLNAPDRGLFCARQQPIDDRRQSDGEGHMATRAVA